MDVWSSPCEALTDFCVPRRAVYGAIVMCMGGVACITQPSFLGFAKNERSLLGVFFACFQVWPSLLQDIGLPCCVQHG